MACCGVQSGPGYPSPLEAIKGPREKLLYVPCIATGEGKEKRSDYLATIDIDPESPSYSKVIHRLLMPNIGDELHHSGWNSCSSCHEDPSAKRRFLILPALLSGNFIIIDTLFERAPSLHKVVEGKEIGEKTGLAYPHTVHCLANGDILASMMGTTKGEGIGGYLLLDKYFNVKGRWDKDQEKGESIFAYDFWYQPRFNVMISSEWGAPKAFCGGFNPQHVAEGKYGRSLHVWNWNEAKKIQDIDLGPNGLIPLEIRFVHNPARPEGFVVAALSSTLIYFYKDKDEWKAKEVAAVEAKEVEGWALPHIPGLITDMLISLDDHFVYFSNWLHGDIRQYDISDPFHPKLVGQVWVGGSIRKGGSVKLKDGSEGPIVPLVQGHVLEGGPQMIQLSLDGKRLYVTNSLFSVWDQQFYPNLANKGSYLLQIDVDNEKGGLKINEKFYVDFSVEPFGPVLAHEVRYPGGDTTSDIWV